MINKIQYIFCVVKLCFLERLMYVKTVCIESISILVSIFIYYVLWKIVFQGKQELSQYTIQEMVTYVILSRILASQLEGGTDLILSSWIHKGKLEIELLRPTSVMCTLFGRRIGEFLFFMICQAVPIMFLSFSILGWKMPTLAGFVLFLVSLLFSLLLIFLVEFPVGLCSIFTQNSLGTSFIKQSVLNIFSGGVVPLDLFPNIVGNILKFLPFAGIISIPVEIFIGNYSWKESLFLILRTGIWVLILLFLNIKLYNRLIKKIATQGG